MSNKMQSHMSLPEKPSYSGLSREEQLTNHEALARSNYYVTDAVDLESIILFSKMASMKMMCWGVTGIVLPMVSKDLVLYVAVISLNW